MKILAKRYHTLHASKAATLSLRYLQNSAPSCLLILLTVWGVSFTGGCKSLNQKPPSDLSAIKNDSYVLAMVNAENSPEHYVFYVCPVTKDYTWHTAPDHPFLHKRGCVPAFMDIFGRQEPYYIPKHFVRSTSYANHSQSNSPHVSILPFSSPHARIPSLRSGILSYGWIIKSQGMKALTHSIQSSGFSQAMKDGKAHDAGKSAYIIIQGTPHKDETSHKQCLNTLNAIGVELDGTQSFKKTVNAITRSLKTATQTSCSNLQSSVQINESITATLVEAHKYIFSTNPYHLRTVNTSIPQLLEAIAELLLDLRAFENPFFTTQDPILNLHVIKPLICLPMHSGELGNAKCLPSELSWDSVNARLAETWQWDNLRKRMIEQDPASIYPIPHGDSDIYHNRYLSLPDRKNRSNLP